MITKLRLCSQLINRNAKKWVIVGRHGYCCDRTFEVIDEKSFKFTEVPVNRIRNFSIIAHVDHGKSTLADRFLEMTGAIANAGQAQVLDSLPVERERGITVKAQSASLLYNYKDGNTYLLNLVICYP